MLARSRTTMAWATSLGGALRYWLQAFCVSSWTSRACHSGAAEVQLALMAASADAPSSPPGRDSSRATVNTATATANRPGCFMLSPAEGECSSLDGGRRDGAAPRLVDEVHGESDRHIRAVVDERQAHLPVAVGDAVLHGHDGALRDPVGRPLTDDGALLLRLAQIGQGLQPDALAGVAVAGGTGKVHRPLAAEEQGLAHLQGRPLLGVSERRRERHAARLGGDVGGERLELG